MAILVLPFWRGFQAPSARFLRIMIAVRAYQSLEHLRKRCWLSYPLAYLPPPAGPAPWLALRIRRRE
jgi:hypothetical protein